MIEIKPHNNNLLIFDFFLGYEKKIKNNHNHHRKSFCQTLKLANENNFLLLSTFEKQQIDQIDYNQVDLMEFFF